MKYDYKEAVKNDIKKFIIENIINTDILNEYNREDLEELGDDLWQNNNITGILTGYDDDYKLEEYLCHNLDLLKEAGEKTLRYPEILKDGVGYCDSTIRLYLLDTCLSDALDDLGIK